MRGPPQKIQESDQNMTEASPPYKEAHTKIRLFMAINQLRTKLLSLLPNPFDLQTKRQLSFFFGR